MIRNPSNPGINVYYFIQYGDKFVYIIMFLQYIIHHPGTKVYYANRIIDKYLEIILS